jgi:hypothetical protein
MTRNPRIGKATLTGIVAFAGTAALLVGAGAATSSSEPAAARSAHAVRLLPDLDMARPDGMKVLVNRVDGKLHFYVGFISAADNIGAGPLIVRGSRSSTSVPTMRAEQVIMRSDGSEQIVESVGELKYIANPTHHHWHLQPFMRYELRRASDYRLMRPDQKQGFCLGDRYPAPWDTDHKLPPLPGKPAKPFYIQECGDNEPQALNVEEGISVGYGDVYSPFVDKQQIDLTGLKAGLYMLVYYVNVPHRLVESNYSNNTSSLIFYLHWPHGPYYKPTLELRGRCAHTARCSPQWGPGS